MQLPEKVSNTINEAVTEFSEAVKYSFLETQLIKEIMEEGAAIALTTPPDGELLDEMRKCLSSLEPHCMISGGFVETSINNAARACAVVAHRHMAALQAENERLRAEVAGLIQFIKK